MSLALVRSHYEGEVAAANALEFIQQLRRLQSAYEACDAAETTLIHSAGNVVEHLTFERIDEKVAAFRMADALGIDLNLLRGALA